MAFAKILIESNNIQEIGESRNKSRLRVLSLYERDEIQDLVLDYICSILSIEVEDLSDLFQT